MLRSNQFDHISYKSILDSKEGKKYFRGVLPTRKRVKSTLSQQPDEARKSVLDLLVPQHIKYRNFGYKEVAEQMK